MGGQKNQTLALLQAQSHSRFPNLSACTPHHRPSPTDNTTRLGRWMCAPKSIVLARPPAGSNQTPPPPPLLLALRFLHPAMPVLRRVLFGKRLTASRYDLS